MRKFSTRYQRFILALWIGFSTHAMAGDLVGHIDHPTGTPDWSPLTLVPVPNGYQPEGAVKGPGHFAYVGSLVSGGIYAVNLVSGKGKLLVKKADGYALGMTYDSRTDYLYVAGGPGGTVTVYDTHTGKQKAVYTVSQPGSFINDGIVTRHAVYFTDSFNPVIYCIPLKRHGHLGLPSNLKTITLSGDFKFIPDNFNGNGIETTMHGDKLYVVNTAAGALYMVDPHTGHTTQVVIDNGDLSNADGMLRRGNKLYVVQNFSNQIAELKLSDDGLSATITNYFTDPNFDVPTAVIGFGKALYALNARFDVAPPPFPPTPASDPGLHYDLVRVELNSD